MAEHTQLTNNQIDSLIENVKSDKTRSEDRKTRMIEHYEAMRPEKIVDTTETIKAWSKQEKGLPYPSIRSDAPPVDEKTKASIEKWAKGYNK